jgi:lycopene beta-cyclase
MIEAFKALRYPRSTLTPLILWVLTMLSLPLLGWILGEGYLLRGMSVGVLMQSAAVLVILYNAWGLARTLKTFAIVTVLSYLAELLGSSTGVPFGKYHYTDILQPQIAGVPLLIPLAWMMMLPPAWAIAEIILSKTINHKGQQGHEVPQRKTLGFPSWDFLSARPAFSGEGVVKKILLSALAFTAWDLFLDPQMVGWDFWRWEVPGQYFGIPLSNYLGWIIVSALITLAANPKDLPVGPLALVYVLTWLLQTLGQGIFWSQPGPAVVGFIGSGIFVFLAWKNSNRRDVENAERSKQNL